MITQLTPEQEKQITIVRDEWLKVGLSCERISREAVVLALQAMYAVVGKAAPKFVILLRSPVEVCVAIALLRNQVQDQVRNQVWNQVWNQVQDQVWNQVRNQVWNQVRNQVQDQVGAQVQDQVWNQVRNQVWNQVRNQVQDQVGAQVQDQVGAQVWNQVWNQVGAQVQDQVGDQVGAQVQDQVGAQVRNQVRNQVGDIINKFYWGFGQFEAGWLSFLAFFVPLVSGTEKIVPQVQFAQSAGWSILFWDWAFVSDRPVQINRDSQNRLHSIDRPALSYSDGFSIYAVHGVRVQERIIMRPETITVEDIETEKNAEVRRIMMDRYGNERYLRDSKANQIHKDEYGTLFLKEMPEDEPLVMVKVINSTMEQDGTFKSYWLRVPPNMRTAREAVAWTWGLIEDEYTLEQQT